MKQILQIIYAALLLAVGLPASSLRAAAPHSVRWHNEASDTTLIINTLAAELQVQGVTAQSRVSRIAHAFVDRPYVAGTLECDPEELTVNFDEFDCTTFVETVLALAMTAQEKRASWPDYVYNLCEIRYRGGKVDGYASRLHYVSDWAVDAGQRGLVTDVTESIPGSEYMTKTINYMSRHASQYPALADSTQLARIKRVEEGYRSHRMPVVKSLRVNKNAVAALQEGDMVVFLSKLDGLDVAHMGFVTIVGGVPHLLHASSTGKKVVVDSLPFTDYMRRNTKFMGIRVFRLRER